MTRCLINRTYTASDRTLAAYPYGGALAGSGLDHRGRRSTLVIGAGSPTAPTMMIETRTRRTHSYRPEAAGEGVTGTGIMRWRVCANTPDSHAGDRSQTARTASTISKTGTGMTTTCEMQVLPENEKDRCANTGLSQEESSVIVVGI